MRGLLSGLLLFSCPLLFACASPRAARKVSPSALKGVTLAVPPPADLRFSPGAGCGQIAPDVPLQAEKALVDAFSKAGAALTVTGSAPWTLTVAIITATVGAVYEKNSNASARPTTEPEPRPGEPGEILAGRGSLFNGDNGRATVTLEATLVHGGTIAWRGTVNGHADSVPCQDVRPKINEALVDAVEALRAEVIAHVTSAGP